MSHDSLPILRWLLRAARFAAAVFWRFREDNCLLRASALAYTSLLSLVPLLALMFAALKGLGVQQHLEPLLLARLALDAQTAQRIIDYIDRTNVATLGTLGAAFLVVTAYSVLSSIEATFNHIWRVERSRTLWRAITDYVSTVLLTPFLLLAAVAITSMMKQQALLRDLLNTQYAADAAIRVLRLAPLAMNCAALAVLYAVMPNRRPHFRSILLAALVAGVVWQGVQWTYVTFQFGMARYNAIYGALAQLPVMLVWIYFSWVVVLLGAELAAVFEFGIKASTHEAQNLSRFAVTAHLLLRAAEAFRSGGGGVEPGAIARELDVDEAPIAALAAELRAAGLLAALEDSPAYVLARDLSTIELSTLYSLLESATIPPGCDHRVIAVLESWTATRSAAWSGRTLADLLEGESPASAPINRLRV